MVDSEKAVEEADIVGVIHDVSNKYTMFQLDVKILKHLFLFPTKPSFLILNKVRLQCITIIENILVFQSKIFFLFLID